MAIPFFSTKQINNFFIVYTLLSHSSQENMAREIAQLLYMNTAQTG